MYDGKTGTILCDWCGAVLGNINGDGNFFALIRTKYCTQCRRFASAENHRAAQRAYRQRKKLEKKLCMERLDLMAQENELLREKIRRMSEDNEIEEP